MAEEGQSPRTEYAAHIAAEGAVHYDWGMRMTKRLGGAMFISAALLACSSEDKTSSSSGSPGSSSGTSGTSGSAASSGGASGTSGTSGTPAAEAPLAPKLDQVAQMAKVLHVMWTNPATKCDSIEGERQAQMPDGTVMEKYKVAFTVAGDIDNKMDTGAAEQMKYTYRLRCKVKSTYSPYSNEAGETPKP